MGLWEAKVLGIREVQPSTFLLRLGCPGIAKEARPGQFYMMRVGRALDPFLPRPFSWLRKPLPRANSGLTKGDVVEVVFKVVGKGTGLLAEVRVGNVLEVQGPLGKGWDWNPMTSPLLVGGGVGAASLLCFVEELPKSVRKRTTALVGARSEELLWLANQMARTGARVFVATEERSSGFHGTVVQLLKEKEAELLTPTTMVYACGPLGMLKEVAFWAMRKGVPCQVSLEVHMACGRGLCLGCAVRLASSGSYVRACKEGPVFKAEEIDWGSASGWTLT